MVYDINLQLTIDYINTLIPYKHVLKRLIWRKIRLSFLNILEQKSVNSIYLHKLACSDKSNVNLNQ